MEILSYIIVALAAYLLGSIPTGYLVAKAKGIDIRSVGSGNIGATNVFRILGKSAGVFVLLVDALKGFAACALLCPLIFNWFAPHFSGLVVYFHDEPIKVQTRYFLIAGIAAILGHNYTCFLKFKGGKGIATTAGVLIALVPWAFLIVLGVFLIVAFLSRYISLASIIAAFCLPFAVWGFYKDPMLITAMAALGALAIYKHKANIGRLLKGTENKFGKKKTAEAAK